MRLLVTGASGLVGGAVAIVAARRGHEVIGITGRHRGALAGVSRQIALPLDREDAVTSAVLEIFPDAIVNGAAISEPSKCDADPGLAQKLNVELPALLARAAQHLGARVIHISTEQVFDGRSSAPYRAIDPPNPVNLYGRQKLASEQAVLTAAPGLSAVVRAPLLLGDSPGGRRSLHERLLADWAAGRTARLYSDEFRQPCSAANLAEVLVALAERPDLGGVFHWAGSELFSRVALGEAVRAQFKLTPAQAPIQSVTRSEAGVDALNRQACLAFDLSPLIELLDIRPQSLAEQLAPLQVPPPVSDWYRGL